MSVHTSHCTHIKSNLTRISLWLVMMDDSAPIHERRKLKTYKNVLPQKQTILKKIIKRWSRKTATDVNKNPTNQRRLLRVRERYMYSDRYNISRGPAKENGCTHHMVSKHEIITDQL